MKMMNADQLSDVLGVVKGTLAKWRLTGEGPPYHKVGTRVMYAADDVRAWLDARRFQSTSQADG